MLKRFTRKPYTASDANSWERAFGRLMTPFESFVSSSTGSGILLIVLTLIALALANSPLAEWYEHTVHTHFAVHVGESFHIDMTLHHWINDALMAVFFFLVGLEIKHEVMVGELSSFRQAILPIMAALGGMIMPAALYFLVNRGGTGQAGWGIPMATDIAFAMAILLLLGKRVPPALMTILAALAIADDLGAVLVIAVFYTESIAYAPLMAAAGCFAFMLMLNAVGVRSIWPYASLGVVMWGFMLFSGIHATLAGVMAAFAIPANSLYRPDEFSREARKLLDKFDIFREKGGSFMSSEQLSGVLHTLEVGIEKAQTPLQRLEHVLHKPVYFLIIPLFVLFNAGVHIDFAAVSALLHSSVVLGVVLGLIAGKFIGIVAAVWLCTVTGLASLPSGVRFRHIIGIGFLAGIGFTMSIFIAELAFAFAPEYLTEAKIAVLAASMLAGGLGYLWLRLTAQER